MKWLMAISSLAAAPLETTRFSQKQTSQLSFLEIASFAMKSGLVCALSAS